LRLGFALAKPCPFLGPKPTENPVNNNYEKTLARTENILTAFASPGRMALRKARLESARLFKSGGESNTAMGSSTHVCESTGALIKAGLGRFYVVKTYHFFQHNKTL
jgi:hypothetical protein